MSLDSDSLSETPSSRRKAHARRGRIDPLASAAAVFFAVAICAAAYPAFQAGPTTGPGLLLLIGLAGVAFLGVFAFATTELRETAQPAADDTLAGLVDALSEPAAVAGSDGRLACANPAWRSLMGGAGRLPKTASGLYGALAAARRLGSSDARLVIAGEERAVVVSRLAGDRLLVRLPVTRSLEVVRLIPDANAPSAPAAAAPTEAAPQGLEAFAGAAPSAPPYWRGPTRSRPPSSRLTPP